MPLYFFIYGMNTSSSPKNLYLSFQFFNQKFKRIMVPYFIWCFIYANGLNSFNRHFFYGILYGSNLILSVKKFVKYPNIKHSIIAKKNG